MIKETFNVIDAIARSAKNAAINQTAIGQFFREKKSMRQEIASIKARRRIYMKPPHGLTQADIETYGIGFPKKS